MKVKEKLEEWFPVVQHYLLLAGGLLGVGYETVVDKIERPYLLVMFGGMMGLAEIAHAWSLSRKEEDNHGK